MSGWRRGSLIFAHWLEVSLMLARILHEYDFLKSVWTRFVRVEVCRKKLPAAANSSPQTKRYSRLRHTAHSLAILLLNSALVAARPIGNDLRFEHLSLEDGLSQSLVLCIAQDSDGFLWFGTEDGLNRYDGYNFKVYRHSSADRSSLTNNYVYCLYKDSKGSLWIGTWGGGLDCYDARKDEFVHYSPSDHLALPGIDKVTGIFEDSRNVLWITTWGGGLCRVDRANQRIEHVPLYSFAHQKAQFDTLHGIAEDIMGRIWVGGFRTGVIVFDPRNDTCIVYRHNANDPGSLSYDNTQVVYRDRKGTMWIGTWGGGLDRYDPPGGRFVSYRHSEHSHRSLCSDVVFSILEDSNGSLWIGTQDGLSCFDSSRTSFVNHTFDPSNRFSLPANRVQSLFEDAGGILWLGTADGLAKLTKRLQAFRTLFPTSKDMSSGTANVFGLCEDHAGNIWIGTYGDGVYCYQQGPGTIRRYHHDDADPRSLSNDIALALCVDNAGSVWIGTYGGGVDRYVPGQGGFVHHRNVLNNENSLTNDFVRSLFADSRGRIWIGTGGKGLDCLYPGQNHFVHYKHDRNVPESLSDEEIECIAEDKSGAIWIGTASGGIGRLAEGGDGFSHYLHDPTGKNCLSDNHVYAIHESDDGTIWIGTAGGGLNRLDPATGTFKCFTEQDGLANNVVYGIVESQRGTLWLSTNKGLSRFTISSGAIKNFDGTDGLQSQEFNFNSYCLLEDGEVLFGGIKGVNIFKPDEVQENTHVPPIVLTSFFVLGEPVFLEQSLQITNAVQLSYKQNSFAFEFAALDFVASRKNQYAYRLEGVDDDWNRSGTRRYVNYTQVEPGEYVFRVKGSNNDHLWNTRGASLRIIIKPPFWATIWFKVLVVLSFLAIATFAYRYRVGRLLEVERMRLRIANDLHDDIGSNLSSIALTNEMVAKNLPQDDQMRSQLLATGSSARQTANALRDIVWLIHPDHDAIEDLILKLRDTAAVMLGTIEYSFDCPEGALKRIRDIGFKRNLFLVFKEILHNIVKHSSATHVTIQITEGHRLLEMSITDDGVGFDLTGESKGNGLKSLRTRTAQMRGIVDIKSNPGKGTTVRVVARIP